MRSNAPFSIFLSRLAVQIWLPALLIALWWISSSSSASLYFPPLSEILSALWRDLTTGRLASDLLISSRNVVVGLAVAIVAGIGFGLAIGEVESLRRTVNPILNFVRAIPQATIVPIIIIAFGIGAAPKIFIIAVACTWPILLNTIDGVRGVSPAIRETSRAYRIPAALRFLAVTLPAASPQIMAGIRIALSIAVVLMVVAELFGADSGVGFYILDAGQRFAVREAWAGTILVGALGYLLSVIFLTVERSLLGWYFQSAPESGKAPASGGK